MKDKYVDRKEEMGKLLEEEYKKGGKDIQEDITGFSMGKKTLKKAVGKDEDEQKEKQENEFRYGEKRYQAICR